MAANVNVLLPTGRRQNVKVTSNTRILQVIENVCSKIGCNPNEYNLKHHRSILDPQLSVRYANLPNNCKLELVKADRPRTESAVHIALQIVSGERLQHDFAPSTSLWDILVHWESQSESPHAGKLTASSQMDGVEKMVHPVCIYLSQEVVGEAWLQATTLKSLGLTGGKAIIRLLHREVDLPAPPSTSNPTKKSPTAQIQSSSQESVSASQGRSTSVKRGVDRGEPMDMQKPDSEFKTSVTEAKNVTKTHTSPKQKSKSEPDITSRDLTSISSTDSEPMEVEGSTNMRQNIRGSASGHVECSAGARPKRKQPRQADIVQQQMPGAPLSQEMEQQANLMGAALAEAILKHRTDQQLTQLKQTWSAKPQSQPTFADFKFPEQPSVQSQSSSLQPVSIQEPCDRQSLVFSLDQGTGDPSAVIQDVPDKFFEVTLNDVRRMMADQQIQMTGDGEQPLQTKAMREASIIKKAQKYSKVAVRVHFPDRYILQGFFRPLEPLSALKDFIRSHLQDPETKFYLYTTPPRSVLKDDTQSLIKAKLFPAAVVYFGSEMACDHYLQSHFMSEMTSFARAKEEAASAIHGSSSLGEAQSSSGSSSNHKSNSSLSGGASTSTASASTPGKQDPQGSSKRQASGESAVNSEKIPKWFKMGTIMNPPKSNTVQ